MKKISKILFVVATTSLLSSCAYIDNIMGQKAPSPIDYLDNAAKMDLKKFFDGDAEGFAIKQGEDGKIIETQTIKVSSSWDDNKGVIKKNTVSNDGTKDNRTWLITMNSDGTFDAVGHDVVTPAKGKQVGNASQATYSLMVNDKSGRGEVYFEERMYLADDNAMIIIANFKRKKTDAKVMDNRNYGKIIVSLKKLSSK